MSGNGGAREARVMVWTPLYTGDILPEGCTFQDAGFGSEGDLLDAYLEHCEREMEEALPHLELVMSWGLSGDDFSGRITCANCESEPWYDQETPCVHEVQVNDALEETQRSAGEWVLKEMEK